MAAVNVTLANATPPSNSGGTPSGGGAALTFSGADVGTPYLVVNDGKTLFVVRNDHVSSVNVTPAPQVELPGASNSGTAVAIASNEEKILGPYDPNIWNIKSGNDAGKMSFITSVANAAIKFAAIKMP